MPDWVADVGTGQEGVKSWPEQLDEKGSSEGGSVTSTVDPTSNLFDWFHQRVRRARSATGAHLSEDGTLYLVQLLAERAREDRAAPRAHTLAELHARAVEAPPAEQARTYRELGDRALYVVGYFPETLERQTVNPTYYVDMGSAAYARTDQVFKRWFANAFGEIFSELAHSFQACASVLGAVRQSFDDEPDLIMRLYTEWLETGDGPTGDRLRALGLVLPPRPETA